MKIKTFILVFSILCFSCKKENYENNKTNEKEIAFEKDKWKIKEGKDYLYRDHMLNNVVYNDTIKSLNKKEVIALLGKPDKVNENHFYYMITQERLGFWPLHTKTMVIKFAQNNTIEWIKIHQ